jgi:hypothetical protein
LADDLRYPVGRFKKVDQLSPDERAAALDILEAAPARMRDAVRGLNDAQLDTPYREGGWTVRQVVHHVPDSHMNAYVRVRLALTEDNPTIKPYEEARWAQLPDARSAPVELSLTLLDAMHARWLLLMRSLATEDFARPFIHPEGWNGTLDTVAAMYAWHCHHHTAHITRLRDRMGW